MNDKIKQEKIKEYYDKGEYFDGAVRYKTWQDLLKYRIQKYKIRKILKIYTPRKKDRVLDLGSALGNISFALSPLVNHATGLDYSKRAVAFAKRLLSASPFRNINFVQASAEKTRLPSGSFDVIFSADLFEHLYPDICRKTLDECFRLLKKGGKLIIWTPNRGHILEILKNNNIILKKDISHVDYKSKKILVSDLTQRGYKILKAYYETSHIPFFNILEKIFIPFLPFMRRRIAILAEKPVP
jgi:ubiquinone/menaquinone biosynthesis C-methylase UbiE